MKKTVINTDRAPSAIGTYSQAVIAGNQLYISGQIPLMPETGTLVEGDFHAQAHQVFRNLQAICHAANISLSHVVKLGVFLTSLSNFAAVNEVMAEYFDEPYPARAAIQVAALPKNVPIEIDAIALLD